jgi:hypothetical protein
VYSEVKVKLHAYVILTQDKRQLRALSFGFFLTGKETPLLVVCTAELVVRNFWTWGQSKYPSVLEIPLHF